MKAFIVFCILVSSIYVNADQSEYNEKSCPKRCSEEYRPLCALNEQGENKVFVNDCYMAIDNCNQSEDKIFHQCDPQNCPQFGEWIDSDWENQID